MSTPDLSLLVDGLRAEREQGITIDVAYRYFGTPPREFVLADTPGHVQYTRNTVTGASTAELAVLLVDARNGVVSQTRRHAAVLSLLRVPRLVLAINKIDLIEYDEAKIADIEREFTELTRSLGFDDAAVQVIPVSALVGDNVASRSGHTPWYTGPTLLEHLESVPVEGPDTTAPFRMPVQYVIRPRTDELHDYRGYAGQVASGTVRPGDEVVVLPEGHRTTVSEVRTADGPLAAAGAGLSVTVLLADDIDAPRGALIAAASDVPEVTSEIDATLCVAGREAAAARRATAAQARHPHHPGDRRGAGVAAGHRDGVLRPRPGEAGDQRHRTGVAARRRPAAGRRLRPRPHDRRVPADRPADGQHARGRAGGRPARGGAGRRLTVTTPDGPAPAPGAGPRSSPAPRRRPSRPGDDRDE